MLSNCTRCKYFNRECHHEGDIRCAIAPAYTAMWDKLKSLDEPTLKSVPVDSCSDFDLDSRLEEKEVSLSLTWKQWQRLIRGYDHSQSILNAIGDRVIELPLSLTAGDWQAIANFTDDSDILDTLAEEGIEPEEKEKLWHEVDSSCIEAISYNRAKSELYIRFCSRSIFLYLYRGVCSDIFNDFLKADSKGQYFNLHIKDRFPYSLHSLHT